LGWWVVGVGGFVGGGWCGVVVVVGWFVGWCLVLCCGVWWVCWFVVLWVFGWVVLVWCVGLVDVVGGLVF
jgi:hypothetical protein